jgi:flagellar FliJ protein
MMKFKFKLERIRKIKEYSENLAKEEYGRILQKKTALETENREMEKSIISRMESNFSDYKAGETIKFEDIILNQKYIDGLNFKIGENEIAKQLIEPELQKSREKLVKATRERKTYDKLREKDYSRYRELYNKNQVKFLDEVATQKFIFNKVEE